MSSPTTHVESFAGSLGAFSGAGAIRYDSGLWLEPGATNLMRNPIAENGTFGVAVTSAVTVEVVELPAPLPDWPDGLVTHCWKVTANEDIPAFTGVFATSTGLVLTATDYALSIWAWFPAGISATGVHLAGVAYAGSTAAPAAADLSKHDQWQRIKDARITPVSGDLSGQVALRHSAGTWKTGEYAYVVALQIEIGARSTSEVAGSFGAGYSSSGALHASSSARAASSASISPTGILDPASGAIAFRVTPTIETGVEEIWGECGVKGAGTDHLRWGRDASKHPFVEWSSNDAAYQRLTASETLNALTAYDLYLGHSATTISLAVDAGTLQTGTRDAVSASWGAGNLTLEASAGGVIYQPFATFDRTLTAKEIATLNGKNNWTMKVLAGNPYTNFQLRPY